MALQGSYGPAFTCTVLASRACAAGMDGDCQSADSLAPVGTLLCGSVTEELPGCFFNTVPWIDAPGFAAQLCSGATPSCPSVGQSGGPRVCEEPECLPSEAMPHVCDSHCCALALLTSLIGHSGPRPSPEGVKALLCSVAADK